MLVKTKKTIVVSRTLCPAGPMGMWWPGRHRRGGDTPLDRHQRSEKFIAITPLVDGAPFGVTVTGRVFDFWRIWCVVFYSPLNSLLDSIMPWRCKMCLCRWRYVAHFGIGQRRPSLGLHENTATRPCITTTRPEIIIWFTYQLNPKIAAASYSTIKPKGSIKSLYTSEHSKFPVDRTLILSCSGSHLASPCWYIYILHICSRPHHDLPTTCLHYNKQDTQDTWILSQTSDKHMYGMWNYHVGSFT